MAAITHRGARVALVAVMLLGVLGATSACGDPCDEYEKVLEKADQEQAYDKYADSIESWRQQCDAQYGL